MDDTILRDRLKLIDDEAEHVNGRIDNVELRLTDIETSKEIKKAHTLEYLVLAIITIETLFTIALYFRHG